MMNPFNRKMFNSKPSRPARNKLNQMGGIMASSVPLMQGVQKFATGNMVRSNNLVDDLRNILPIQIDPRLPMVRRLNQTPPTSEMSKLNLEQRKQDDENLRAVYGVASIPGAAMATGASAVSAGISNIIDDVAFSSLGRQLGFSEYGEKAPPPAEGTDYLNKLRTDGVFADSGSPEIDAVISEKEQLEQDAIKEKLEAEGYDLSQEDSIFSPQPSTLGFLDPGAANRPKTLAEQESFETSDKLGDSIVSSSINEFNEDAEMMFDSDSVVDGFTSIGASSARTALTGESKTTTKEGVEKPTIAKILPSSTGQAVAEAGERVNATMESIADLIANPNVSEIEKNDAILEQFGKKSPEENIKGLKKRAELNAQLYRDIAGVDPEEDKKIDGYNLAMMGFMIAAGDSPDALQNIAAGMAKGTSMMMDTKKARQERDRQFKIAGLDKAITDDKERKQVALDAQIKADDRKFSLLNDQLKGQRQQHLVMIQLAAKENMLTKQLDANLALANSDNLSAELKAKYDARASVIRSTLTAFPELSVLALDSISMEDLLNGSEEYGKVLNQVINDSEQLEKAERIAAINNSGKKNGGPQAMTPERLAQELMTDQQWVERTTDAILEDLKDQGIEEPTQSQINTGLRNRARQQASTPITGGAAAPADDGPVYSVGQTVMDKNGKKAIVTEIDSSGNVISVESIQ